MSKRVVVLGAGMVGQAIIRDLHGQVQVKAVDRDPAALSALNSEGVETVQADLSNAREVTRAISDADLVIGAVPGFMGFSTLETVIRTSTPVVDISFFPEDAMQLDDLAREMRVPVIVDAGVAPGMSNFLIGFHHHKHGLKRARCCVGGLPVERRWPFAYKAPFSPIDVIEEYTRPARLKEQGRIVERPALTEPEMLHFDGIGSLEAFNTDGLRTLLNLDIPDMSEKTLRYPGHREQMLMLKDGGFFDSAPVDVNGVSISPLEFTSRLLLRSWKLDSEEDEFTVMRITLESEKHRWRYNLHDRRDPATKTSSMARTTGYACTAMAQLMIDNTFNEPGIHPPEHLGAHPGAYDRVLEYLKERGVNYGLSEESYV